MKGVLALFGSGEFTKAMAPIDKFLLSKVKAPKVAIFPTAAGLEVDWDKWINAGEKYYKKLGVFSKGFRVIDRKSANDLGICNEIKEFNFFVLSGGDPGYLLDTLKNSWIWKTILDKFNSGSTLIGSSAGAMVFGKKTWGSIYKFDKEGVILPWVNGLQLVDFGILPHFNVMASYFGPQKMEIIKNNIPIDIEVVGIDEDTAYIGIDNSWIIKGNGSVHVPIKI